MNFCQMFEMIEQIKKGQRVSDTRFDKLFPHELRSSAQTHWTPIAVVQKAVEWLTLDLPLDEKLQILDVGSGVGKFCIVGSLISQAYFVGVERRKEFVDVSRKIARAHKIERVRFLFGDMGDLDWTVFRGIYLYNPFYENLEGSPRIDLKVPLNPALHAKYVGEVNNRLSQCKPGTRVVSYYGFGGDFSADWEKQDLVASEIPQLEFWIKRELSES